MAITDLDEAAAQKIPIGDAARPNAVGVVDGHRVPAYETGAGQTQWLTGQVLRGAQVVTQTGHGFAATPSAAAYVADAGGGSPGWVLVTSDLADVDPGALVVAIDGDDLTIARSGTYVAGVDLGHGPLWMTATGAVSTTRPIAPDTKVVQVGSGEGAQGYHVAISTALEGEP